ncbi:DUF1659 domain-containing protein [Desulfosporosinus sp. SYSU MS00001]|uniref:DUF1659 domain-containing protein n=1 Tax=Desulfosporosinus sp. SYSU MS00001 TaxID=3416284 RepID=UPI003CF1F663
MSNLQGKGCEIMPVVASTKDTVMVITYQIGLTDQGSPKLTTRSFPNIKSASSDQDVYDVATALYSLQEYPLISVRRDNRVDLTQ